MSIPNFTLPTETWSRIFYHVWAPLASLPTPALPWAPLPLSHVPVTLNRLRSLSLTCKRFHALATPLIWRRVDVEGTCQLRDFLRSPNAQRQLALTQIMVIADQGLGSADQAGLEAFGQLLPSLPRLDTLHFMVPPSLLWSFLPEKSPLASAIRVLHVRICCPADFRCIESLASLSELTLEFDPISSHQWQEPTHQLSLPSVDTLTIYVTDHEQHDSNQANMIWGFLARSSLPALRNFTSLMPSTTSVTSPGSPHADSVVTHIQAFTKRNPQITDVHVRVRDDYDEKVLKLLRATSVEFDDNVHPSSIPFPSPHRLSHPHQPSSSSPGYVLRPSAVTLLPDTLRAATFHARSVSLSEFEKVVRALANDPDCGVREIRVCALAGREFALGKSTSDEADAMRAWARLLRKKSSAFSLVDSRGQEVCPS